tara:strand:- start:36 stop:341 length:306 start_codon:yes stop_codon:yes gene_type:complete
MTTHKIELVEEIFEIIESKGLSYTFKTPLYDKHGCPTDDRTSYLMVEVDEKYTAEFEVPDAAYRYKDLDLVTFLGRGIRPHHYRPQGSFGIFDKVMATLRA